MRPGARLLLWVIFLAGVVSIAPWARADEPPEYRLKAAFLYNFALFTEWPATVGNTLNLCIRGKNPFGDEIDGLEGKAVNARKITVQRKGASESLKSCHIVFIAASAMGSLPQVLDELRDSPVLTVADSPGAARQGVILNMTVKQNKVAFEANLQAAHAARISLSSKLLRLATEVHQ
jgi:hypothetical protein